MDAELKKLHDVEVEILNEVDDFCKKNNIKYFLCGGTLLGSVRHKGFIPWDDDIDIAMLREDYEKFINTYKDNDKYYVQCYEKDKKYWNMFAKVRKKNTLFDEARLSNLDVAKEIFIDIFPIDNAPAGGYKKIRFRANMIRILNSAYLLKMKAKRLDECKFKILTLLLTLFSYDFLNKKQYKMMVKNKNDNCIYTASFCSAYSVKKEYVLKEEYFPLIEGEFEGRSYPIPNNYKEYLTNLYGDYMKLPPENERITHKPLKIVFDTREDK